MKKFILASSLLVLAACTTVGPDYRSPEGIAPVSSARGGFARAGEGIVRGAPLARWWEALGDPVLGQLIDAGLTASPNVDVAVARLRQARAGAAIARTANVPTIGTSSTALHIDLPTNVFTQPDGAGTQPGADAAPSDRYSTTFYNLGFDASWEIDLFGGRRRQQEQARYKAEAALQNIADAQVSVSADIARVYAGLRAQQAVLALRREQRAIDLAQVGLAQQRFDRGTALLQLAEAARSDVGRTDADIAAAEAEIAVAKDQLALLTGREPASLDALLDPARPVPLPPATVAIDDPASLLRRRPDIRAAERNLAAATANVGVKTADRFPKISFLGMLGMGGPNLADILDPSRIVALAAPRLNWTLFDGGRANRQVDLARGEQAEAFAQYRGAVLAALQDAESSLARFGARRTQFARTLDSERHIGKVADLQSLRARGGTIAQPEALKARRDYLQTRLATVDQRSRLLLDYIALNKALGLGWAPFDETRLDARPEQAADRPKAR